MRQGRFDERNRKGVHGNMHEYQNGLASVPVHSHSWMVVKFNSHPTSFLGLSAEVKGDWVRALKISRIDVSSLSVRPSKLDLEKPQIAAHYSVLRHRERRAGRNGLLRHDQLMRLGRRLIRFKI